MKIDDQTNYSTDLLRALLTACFRAVGIPTRSKRSVHVKFTSARKRDPTWCGGQAQLGRSPLNHGRRMTMTLPPGGVDYARLTWVMLHEALHLAGAEHKDMTRAQNEWRDEEGNTRPAPKWAPPASAGYVVPEEVRVAACAPTSADKLEHARKMYARAMTREKRAATIRKKWQRRVVLYVRKAGSS